jgi:uncharacterized Zn finger protein
MANPWTIYCECESCGDITLHEVLKGQVNESREATVTSGVLKCKTCGKTGERRVREDKPVVLQVMLSEGEGNRRSTIVVDPDEKVQVGDEMFVGKDRILVTALEAEGKRVEAAAAREKPLIWSKVFNRVRVKVSINRGHSTAAEIIDAAPDEEFQVGEILTIKRTKAVIHTIKTEGGTVRRGGTPARFIQRIYAREMRETYR